MTRALKRRNFRPSTVAKSQQRLHIQALSAAPARPNPISRRAMRNPYDVLGVAKGASEADIDTMLVDNPRRYFE